MWSWLSVALSGFISISASENNHKKQAIFFSSFALFLLLVMLWTQESLVGISAWWVSLGLIISILADALYIRKKAQRTCFAFFLAAQICYSTSFWLQISGEIVWWLPAMLLAMGIVVFFLLLPKIDRLIFPVVIMGMALIQLNWAAGEVWLLQQNHLLGLLGTLSLTLSAALLAIHDYRHPIWFGRYLITGSYLLAHCLITASFIN
ncbi:lysoplasmalogenase family protein [Vibrio sp. LaRot3]|uniref:lysoplasmalogenase family protein n=1 Tax=Vibrio sp. LaRot3 TaxID=2998829 RepID=UPI0022CDCC69|nr:lysoplasmalogenase family protein [Vibrio sp. LaRot3]MDA0150315.1 lysoplasmalogenase family protein [Vibrio sp. LaRot3]